jgi:hypothetical protein
MKQMWEITQQKWEKDGEAALAATFASIYITDENFCHWFYATSGRHGIVPCNNPMERHNLAIKGCTTFEGYVDIGKYLYTCVTKEFVKLVNVSSSDPTSPYSGLPVLDYGKAINKKHFMMFQNILDKRWT